MALSKSKSRHASNSRSKSRTKSRTRSRSNIRTKSRSNRKMRAGRPPVDNRMSGGMIKGGTVVLNLPHHNKNLKKSNRSRKRTKSRRSRF